MSKVVDTLFKWQGFGEGLGKWESKCRLRIYKQPAGKTVAIATELAENEGTSITNSCENVAKLVCKTYGIDPSDLIWIEHYLPSSYYGGDPDIEETFDLVTLDYTSDGLARPDWKGLMREEVEALIGQTLDPP